MPYKDPERQRQAQRAAYRRLRIEQGKAVPVVKARQVTKIAKRVVPNGAYELYLGITLRGHPSNEQRLALYAILDALPPEAPKPPRAKPEVRVRPPKDEAHVFVPGPADPAFVARVLHGRGCDCRYCVEARMTRRFG